MRAQLIAGISLVLTLSACSPFESELEATTTEPPSASTIAPTTTIPLVAGCIDDGEFVEDGLVARVDQAPSDATTIGAIVWDETDACETFDLVFTTSEGAPATTPPSVEAFYLPDTPILRVAVDAEHTVVTDQLVETGLVSRLYVVRALDGGMFVDFHLAAPAQAHVQLAASPAELTLHLQPGIVEHPTAPAVSDLVVIASPLDRATVTTSFDIEGYARTSEATVLVIATAGDQVVAETVTTAADWLETWGEYRLTLDIPEGDTSIFVGEESPQDGSLEGIAIRVTVK